MADLVERAAAGDADAVRALIAAGASPNALDPAGDLPLVVAARRQRPEVVRALLDLGADPNLADGTGRFAVEEGLHHQAILRTLLRAGADPNVGDPPLIYLAAKHTRLLAPLLEHGADPNRCTRRGETALTFAADWGHLDALEILLAAGADPNQVDPESGNTALLYAVSEGREEAVRLLLDAGADPLAGSANGEAKVMERTLAYGWVEIATLLLERFPNLAASGWLDVSAQAEALGDESLAARLASQRWSTTEQGLRARLRIVQSPSLRGPKGELTRQLEVLVDLENVGQAPLSLPSDDPLAFQWRLRGPVGDEGAIEELPARISRTEVMSCDGWTRLRPGECHTQRVSCPPEGQRAYELDLVTAIWPSLGADEPAVHQRLHLSGRYQSRAPGPDAPADVWRGHLEMPARAIR